MADKTTNHTNISHQRAPLKERISTSSKNTYHRTVRFIKSRPLGSFLLVLGILLVLLIVGKIVQPQTKAVVAQPAAETVKVYSIGTGPQATFQAKIEKSGVVKIVAQAAGIVSNIAVKEGDTVSQGEQLISLSSNYQGGNAASVQREIAQTQYQNVLDSFGEQNDLISRQRDVATASAQNAQQTRDITNQSVGETGDLINANQSQLDQINQTISGLQASNTNNANTQQIQTLQGTANQLQSGINQLKEAQRTASYQGNNANPPALLANLQEDVALKQLDIQAKTLQLNKDVSKLQVSLAAVSEAIMYPSTPFSGTVDRVYVHPGDSVTPGTELASITGSDIDTTAVLLVPQAIAQAMTIGEPSTIMINGKSIVITPFHISAEATDGQLYTVIYAIPKNVQSNVTDGQYVDINVPLGAAKTTSVNPLIPIDAVYQNQEQASVLVMQNKKAVSKNVTLGNVFGNFVQVQNGLTSGDQVILNRNVIAGDPVKL